MRNAFAEALYEAARVDARICIVCADISPAGSMAKFRDEFPARFINVGVAEQAMVGIAAGLALKGMRPFCYSIATFSLYRPFEFVRDDLCYQNLPVTVVGIGGGVTYSTLGATHYAQEDIAIAGALPNMTILAPCDPLETAECVRWICENDHGPVYLRLGKAGEPSLTENAWPFEVGSPRMILSTGSLHTAIVTYGPIAALAVEAAKRVDGDRGDVFVFPFLKPLPDRHLLDIVSHYGNVVVVEEHVLRGGLGERVKASSNALVGGGCSVELFTLQDKFIHCYGSHRELLAAHGITVEAIMEAAS